MTKKYIYQLLYLFVLFLLQTAALKVFAQEFFLIPHLVLLFVIIFALNHSFPQALWIGFLGGFLLELFSGQFFGAQIFSLLLIAAAVYFVTRNLTTQEISAPAIIFLVVLGTALFGFWIFSYTALASFLGIVKPAALGDLYSIKIFWSLIVNLLFFYPVRFIFELLPK